MKSIVLLKIRPGQVNEAHNKLRQLQTVLECCMSYGQYDEAAVVRAETLEELWQIIKYQIKPICGVVDIFPCLIEEDRSLKDPPQHVRDFVMING